LTLRIPSFARYLAQSASFGAKAYARPCVNLLLLAVADTLIRMLDRDQADAGLPGFPQPM
jgi:hypothetical protein